MPPRRRRAERGRARVLLRVGVLGVSIAALLVASDLAGFFPVLSMAPASNVGSPLQEPAPLSAPHHVYSAESGILELALTPPMGWNGYNHFHLKVTAATVEAAARALVSSNMEAAGYTYVNLDGGWALRWRDASGALQPDPKKFPHGIKPVVDYVHSLGLKFGIYLSAGIFNCAGTSAGSFGHYRRDAAQLASWGVDYLKLDWCDIPYFAYPGLPAATIDKLLAAQMEGALAATHRQIVFDLNDWTNDRPWSWATHMAQMWRVAPDIQDRYQSMLFNFTRDVARFPQARPGGWNDPDMLEVGNGGMSLDEYRSMFSLWAEMSAPLIAGNDLTQMSAATKAILTNAAVIAVDQDPLGRQGYPVASQAGHWVITKQLQFGDRAILLFNQTNVAATVSTTAPAVGMPPAASYDLVDLWSGETTTTLRQISAVVPPHGVVMYKVSVAPEPPGASS